MEADSGGKGGGSVKKEMEIVACPQIGHLNLMVNTMQYRTPHLHREFEILWLLEGALQVRGPGLDLVGQEGEMLVFNPLQSHEFCTSAGGCTFLCIQIAPQFFRAAEPEMEQLYFDTARPFQVLDAAAAAACRSLMLELGIGYFGQAPHYALQCTGLAHLLAYTLVTGVPCRTVTGEQARAAREKADRLTRLLDFADANYTHKVRLTDFAAQEGLSLGYLSHFAKENLNRTFQEYIAELRFHQACKLLQGGGRRVLDVCLEAGFSDPRYLSEEFRRRLGMTPEEYRRRPVEVPPDVLHVHRSPHTLERMYTPEKSLEILRRAAARQL